MQELTLPIDVENTYKQAIDRSLELCQEGNYEVAEVILRQLLRCDPEHKEAIQLLGLVRHKNQDYVESHRLFSEAVRLSPENPDNYNNLALAQACRGQVKDAVETLSKALELTPKDDKNKRAQYLSNMSIQLRRLGEYEKAYEAIQNAISYTDRKDVSVLKNLASLLGDSLKTEESISVYQEVLELDPKDAQTHVDLAYSLHLKGDLESAWKAYEYRYEVFPQFGYLFRHYNPKLLWKGEDLENKTISIYCEQGIGDLIHFVRYIPVLKEKHNCKVVLHYHESCVDLLKNSNLGIDEFFSESPNVAPGSMKIPNHDYHVSLLSLPNYLSPFIGINESSYLVPSESASLGEKKEFRVGICWAGSPQHPNDSRRSVYLSKFEELSKIDGVKLFGFQKEMRPRKYRYEDKPVDLMEGGDKVAFVDLSEHLTDLNKTASLLKEMDLVVTVDTSLLHLAGSLGIETWGLIPYVPDWRWSLKEKETSSWYPSLRLFRQSKPNVWDDVFEKVLVSLKEKIVS